MAWSRRDSSREKYIDVQVGDTRKVSKDHCSPARYTYAHLVYIGFGPHGRQMDPKKDHCYKTTMSGATATGVHAESGHQITILPGAVTRYHGHQIATHCIVGSAP